LLGFNLNRKSVHNPQNPPKPQFCQLMSWYALRKQLILNFLYSMGFNLGKTVFLRLAPSREADAFYKRHMGHGESGQSDEDDLNDACVDRRGS